MAIKLVGPRLVQEKACQWLPDERGQHLARDDEHRHRGLGGDNRILMLQEVLHMRAWLAILARRAGQREPRKSRFCQPQADRGDTRTPMTVSDAGRSLQQPTAAAATAGGRPPFSLPRQQSPKRRFQF
jgi:hypothetical protein